MTATKDRHISLDLEVQILTCADTGIPELVVDNDVVTADEARTRIAQAEAALPIMRKLVRDYEGDDPAENPGIAITPFCSKYDWCVEHDLSDGTVGHCGPTTTVALADDVPVGLGTGGLLNAQVYASDRFGGPEVWASVEGHDELVLNADQLGALIESLDKLRPALAQMRDQVNQGAQA
jgi:hypothetical protein